MPRADVTIKTRDGNCPTSLFTPASGKGPWPGVIFYMDGLGIRPVMWEMGQRLADGGYVVLQPDLYYRFGSYPPKVAAEVLGNPQSMQELMTWVNSLDRDRKVSDSGAFIDFLSSRPEVKGKRFGASGYCMGGNASLTAAGAFPERFSALSGRAAKTWATASWHVAPKRVRRTTPTRSPRIRTTAVSAATRLAGTARWVR